jgi:hypothetical protein
MLSVGWTEFGDELDTKDKGQEGVKMIPSLGLK